MVNRPALKRQRSSSTPVTHSLSEGSSTQEQDNTGHKPSTAALTPVSWQCDKCLKIFEQPVLDSMTEEEAQQAEAHARAEHADYHFALELSRTVEPGYRATGAEIDTRLKKRASVNRQDVKPERAGGAGTKKLKKDKGKEDDKGSIRAFLQPKKEPGNGR